MDKITTTIREEPLRQIVAGTKRIEYGAIKPYWTRRLQSVSRPFLLRLIDGMRPQAPEATLLINEVRRNQQAVYYELHIGAVRDVRHLGRTIGRRKS
jgi:hypothetical protein